MMAAENFLRVPQAYRNHRRIAHQLYPADTFESRYANQLQRHAGSGHKPRFHSALGSYRTLAPSSCRLLTAPGYSSRYGQRRKDVPRRCRRLRSEAFCSPALTSRGKKKNSACWLIFKSTPVASSIPSKLDPP